MHHMFFITVLKLKPLTRQTAEEVPWERRRTWGFYAELDHARRVVEYNSTDIFENGYYDFAVIEQIEEGPLGLRTDHEWWAAMYPALLAKHPIVEPVTIEAIRAAICDYDSIERFASFG